jgi:hypothetical protein
MFDVDSHSMRLRTMNIKYQTTRERCATALMRGASAVRGPQQDTL